MAVVGVEELKQSDSFGKMSFICTISIASGVGLHGEVGWMMGLREVGVAVGGKLMSTATSSGVARSPRVSQSQTDTVAVLGTLTAGCARVSLQSLVVDKASKSIVRSSLGTEQIDTSSSERILLHREGTEKG